MQFLSIFSPLLLFSLAEAHFPPWDDARSCKPRECLLNNRCVSLMDQYTCCTRPSHFGHKGKPHHICPPSKSMHVCQYGAYYILITPAFSISQNPSAVAEAAAKKTGSAFQMASVAHLARLTRVGSRAPPFSPQSPSQSLQLHRRSQRRTSIR